MGYNHTGELVIIQLGVHKAINDKIQRNFYSFLQVERFNRFDIFHQEDLTDIYPLNTHEMETFETPFPHGFILDYYGVGEIPKTVDEMDLITLSIAIREKPNWAEKMNDPLIVAKWKAEIADSFEQNEKKFDFVMAELGKLLHWKGSSKLKSHIPFSLGHYLSIKDGSIEVAAVDCTWQSDELIDKKLKDELIAGVSVLENVPSDKKDWHPGSNNQVLDLVHPSLFCYVAGRTKVLAKPMPPLCNADDVRVQIVIRTKKTELNSLNFQTRLKFASDEDFLQPQDATNLAMEHTNKVPSYSKSSKFQWLPSEFFIDESGAVKINSYINNLHPDQHPQLYTCIEKIFEKFVPMFNKVLTGLRNPPKNRIVFNYDDTFEYSNRDDGNEDDEDAEPTRIRFPLKIPTYAPPPMPEKIVNLNGRNVQVIVKLANIHLTPDNPEYPGIKSTRS